MYRFLSGRRVAGPGAPAVAAAAAAASAAAASVAGHEAYWADALRNLEFPSLPGRRERAAGHVPQQARLSVVVPDAVSARLAGLFTGQGPAELLQAVFVAYLARTGGRPSFDLGYSHPGLAALAAASPGSCAAVVPMRVTVDLDRGLEDLAVRLQTARNLAADHRTFALDLPSRHPELLGAAASMTGPALAAVYEVADLQDDHAAVAAELALVVADRSTRFDLRYDREVFGSARVERMSRHLLALLEDVVRDPAGPVGRLNLLTAAERRQQFGEWNPARTDYPAGRTVADLFEAQVVARPGSAAVTDGATGCTYAELNSKANRLARHLRRHGVERGVVVGLCVERSPWMMVALLGIVKAGGAYLPLDPGFPPERLAFMLQDSGAPLLLTQNGLDAALPHDSARVVLLDSDWPEIAAEEDSNLLQAAGPEGLAYVLYTSGSTGKPKGVEIPHRALTNFLCSMRREPGLGADDTLLALTTLSFDIAGLELFLPLISGARVELASREVAIDPRQLAARIEQCRPTMMQATPSTWQMLIEAGWEGSPGMVALCGGESLPRQLADKLRARTAALWNMYGPTETTVWSSIHRVSAADEEITIGRPIANTRLHILDGLLQPVPAGVPGELFIAGDGLALGYRNRADLTADRFIADPISGAPGERLYRTGDLARYRDDGAIVHLGRIDFQVKVRGYRIELGEIENALTGHAGVAQAVVVAREDATGVTSLAAYVVAAPGHVAAAADLREHLHASLPDYMVPQHFVPLQAMPLTPNGKIDRKQLPAPQRSRPAVAADFAPAANASQVALAGIWEAVLGVEPVGLDDNFFELGGSSLLAVRMLERVERSLGWRVSIGQAFARPTVRGLEGLLKEPAPQATSRHAGPRSGSSDIAIVGMAGRFAGCGNIEEYWQALCEGRELITFFEDADIDAAIDRRLLQQPNYVKARGIIADADCFDAAFFGVNPKEADVIDPQQRVLLEVAWHALENAGIHGNALEQQRVSVFAGVGENAYYRRNLLGNPAVREHGEFRLRIANEKDYVATRIAYSIGLRGPAVNVQTACSTSLVAVSLAMQSLRAGESDVALCGGASIPVPQKSGHEYNEGSAYSRDGHCRPYDADASGTVFSSGAGIVVLMRRDQATAEGRRIYAVLKGSGVNNDGSGKMSFMAPSVEGQARVLAQALDDARSSADDVTYVEGHGTATPLGDPIEVEALATVYGDPARPTYLGSVKGNIGHADAAAGVAGLIKTALALHHRQLPPSINFLAPNPRIPLAQMGFEVNTRLRPWPARRPLCAAVTSLGVGGTNVHVILEAEAAEAKTADGKTAEGTAEGQTPASSKAEETPHLLLFSGRTQAAAARLSDSVLLHVAGGSALAAAAGTLAHHRRHFKHRRFQVLDAKGMPSDRSGGAGEARGEPSVAFMFPGQGSQYPRMGQTLYRAHPPFRSTMDRCAEILLPELGCDIRDLLFHGTDATEAIGATDERLEQTRFTQPLLFAIGVSLSDLWQSWNVRPGALIGHSIGEYAAACLAGVFDLEDALRLVAARGRMMASLPSGAMLSVGLAAADLLPLLGDELAIAAVNGPRSCVASGAHAPIAALRQLMDDRGVQCRLLRTSHAFHSAMMDPVLPAFEAQVARLTLAPPRVPIMSTVTARWLTADEATSPAYWAQQLRLPVRFAEALEALWKHEDYVALELGPRATATTLARRVAGDRKRQVAIPSMPDAPESERAALLGAVGQLWAEGVAVELRAAAAKCSPTSLPGYPFSRDQHWIEAAAAPLQDGGSIRALLEAQAAILRTQVAILERKLAGQPSSAPAEERIPAA